MGSSNSKPAEASSSAAAAPPASSGGQGCPVLTSDKGRAIYNVYGERVDGAASCPAKPNVLSTILGYDKLDPTNQMPLEPNQQPCPGQKKLLSTERVASNIPKGGTQSTWLYPSPQMFYNALKRKGKGADVTEDVMASVVSTHNTLNELTWQAVRQWEALHQEQCGAPRLLHFRGRPDQLSPLARLSTWFGGPEPFDRHDWFVDRCGHEVRYVIDFYFDESKAGSPEAFELRVRPAVDTLGAVLDRTKMAIYTTFATYGLPCPVTGHASKISKDAQPGDKAEQMQS